MKQTLLMNREPHILFSKLIEIDALAYFPDWLGRYQAGAGGSGERVEQNAT